MTDKEIREKVESLYKEWRLHSSIEAKYRCEAYKELLEFIGSDTEEPVSSVWHNMDEVPIKGEVIVVQTKDTFYGVSVQKGGTTYKNRNKDRYVKWAYASDLLSLSNVERIVKDWKEPANKNLEEAAKEYCGEGPEWQPDRGLFVAGAKWQNGQLINKACEWLSEHICDYEDAFEPFNRTYYFDVEKLIEEFRKAMEG